MTELIACDVPAVPYALLGRVVLTHGIVDNGGHEAATHRVKAVRVAALLDLSYRGACERGEPFASSYLIPRAPLSGRSVAAKFAIRSEADLLGGWVPRHWMASKAIMHPLLSAEATAPSGWSRRLGKNAVPLTLRGITAFSPQDAMAAGRLLLQDGPVRIKPTGADGGRGQIVAHTVAQLQRAVAGFRNGAGLSDILVLEENLEDVVTYSVGQVRLPGHTVSYCGTQSTTLNNDGAEAYGGSMLFVVRGGFERLMARSLPDEIRSAITKAVAFDALCDRHIPGLIASRRNYDVACGTAADGSRRTGVLEQSWRVGGATGAEIAALEVFAREPRIAAVHARTVEIYGHDALPPKGATLYYRATDPVVGPLTKYTCVEEKIEG